MLSEYITNPQYVVLSPELLSVLPMRFPKGSSLLALCGVKYNMLFSLEFLMQAIDDAC